MNEYKITYSVNGKTYTTNRVEHTEATAKRPFEDRESAELETAALEEQYDYVAIITEVEV